MTRRKALLGAASGVGLAGWLAAGGRPRAAEAGAFRLMHSDEEWRRLLTPDQYAILRAHGTEPPGSSPLDHEFRPGRYDCAGCRQAAYSSTTKFDSHTGWPSFWEPLPGGIATSVDESFFTTRIEVHCSNCGGHLGHVFKDGPQPTGLRYCMNGNALTFQPQAVATGTSS